MYKRQAHLLPHWGFFSDSFVNAPAWARVTWFSWLTAIIEIAADLALAIVGSAVLVSRRREADAPTGSPRIA